jgi:hypothetical protein
LVELCRPQFLAEVAEAVQIFRRQIADSKLI